MENEYLHMLARVVLPAQILEYFTIVGVEQTSTEIHVSLDEKILRYFPYVEKLMPMIKYLSEKMDFNDNLIKALCTFKEIPVKDKLYSTILTNRFLPMVWSAPSKRTRREDLTLESMVFRITLGSDARKISLWKRWDCRQVEAKIEG